MLSRTRKAVIWAHDKGYRVQVNGQVLSHKGNTLRLAINNKRGNKDYACFGIKGADGKSCYVLVHHLVAYQKFGDKYLYSNLVVRHLDGDSLNNAYDNIAIGTRIEDAHDKPPEVRQRAAQKAALKRRKFSEVEVKMIRQLHVLGATCKDLADRYDCAKSTISYIVRRITYRNVV
jgi:hypothetical protein